MVEYAYKLIKEIAMNIKLLSKKLKKTQKSVDFLILMWYIIKDF